MDSIDFKSPYVIGGGILLAAILLLKGSSGSSQNVVQTSGIDTNYLALQNINAQQNIASLNSQTQIQLQQLTNAGAVDTAIAQSTGSYLTAAGVATGATAQAFANGIVQNNLAMTNNQSQIAITGINTRAGVLTAKILSDAQQNIAQINASAAVGVSNNTTSANMFGTGIGSLGLGGLVGL